MRDAFGRAASIVAIALSLGACAQNTDKPNTALTKGAEQQSSVQTTHDGKAYSCGKVQEKGVASIYTVRENGTRTASGIPFRDNGMTVAHKTLPMGTMVAVNTSEESQTVLAKVTDRGPYVHGRILDLIPYMARRLGIDGLGLVHLRVCSPS